MFNLYTQKNASDDSLAFFCRDGGIRTHDLADPNGARWPGCATSRITVVIITVGFLFDKPNVKESRTLELN